MSPVSAELRSVAEAAFRALNEHDLDAFLEVTTEDVEFTSMIAEVEGQTFRGHDGVRRWWSTVVGMFQEMRWELLDIDGSSDRGVAKLRAVGVLGGVEVEQTVWQAATLRDGKVGWWAFFRNERDAREAAGVRAV